MAMCTSTITKQPLVMELQPNETYRLVEGSYYELKFDEEMDSFSCGNISLQPSERFTVRQGDVVGFCEESDTVWYHENRDSSLLRWHASGCSVVWLHSKSHVHSKS